LADYLLIVNIPLFVYRKYHRDLNTDEIIWHLVRDYVAKSCDFQRMRRKKVVERVNRVRVEERLDAEMRFILKVITLKSTATSIYYSR
jgi:hypothetical protein